jgi:hypothetical protein
MLFIQRVNLQQGYKGKGKKRKGKKGKKVKKRKEKGNKGKKKGDAPYIQLLKLCLN